MIRSKTPQRSLRPKPGRRTLVLLLVSLALSHCSLSRITRPYRKPIRPGQFAGKRLLIALPEVRGQDKCAPPQLAQALLDLAPAQDEALRKGAPGQHW